MVGMGRRRGFRQRLWPCCRVPAVTGYAAASAMDLRLPLLVLPLRRGLRGPRMCTQPPRAPGEREQGLSEGESRSQPRLGLLA